MSVSCEKQFSIKIDSGDTCGKFQGTLHSADSIAFYESVAGVPFPYSPDMIFFFTVFSWFWFSGNAADPNLVTDGIVIDDVDPILPLDAPLIEIKFVAYGGRGVEYVKLTGDETCPIGAYTFNAYTGPAPPLNVLVPSIVLPPTLNVTL